MQTNFWKIVRLQLKKKTLNNMSYCLVYSCVTHAYSPKVGEFRQEARALHEKFDDVSEI